MSQRVRDIADSLGLGDETLEHLTRGAGTDRCRDALELEALVGADDTHLQAQELDATLPSDERQDRAMHDATDANSRSVGCGPVARATVGLRLVDDDLEPVDVR